MREEAKEDTTEKVKIDEQPFYLPGSISYLEADRTRLGWTTAWRKCFICGWAVSLVDRRRTPLYVGASQGEQSATEGDFLQAVGRPTP
jgi:hypothetical protein